jgi:hypothetical protein
MAPPIGNQRIHVPYGAPAGTPPDVTDPTSVLAPISEQYRTVTSAQQQGGGLSLGAAILSLSFEESRPTIGGGLSLYARQQRELDRLKGRVGKLEQEA